MKNIYEWYEWANSPKRPEFIPKNPQTKYKEKGWISYPDWLGTDFLPFEEAKKIVHKFELQSKNEWEHWCKSDQKPSNIPVNPRGFYKEQWINFGDWLGTGYVAPKDREYLPFKDQEAHQVEASIFRSLLSLGLLLLKLYFANHNQGDYGPSIKTKQGIANV